MTDKKEVADYEALQHWLKRESMKPRLFDKITDRIQKTAAGLLPEQIQSAITKGMEGFTRVVLVGSGVLLPKQEAISLRDKEDRARQSIQRYVHLGMISGAGTSAGGIITGLLDLPLLMSMKIKLIFEIGSHFGYDLSQSEERYFALMIFRETFSNANVKPHHLENLIHFEAQKKSLKDPLERIDWQRFQQEYRDYIDLAKLMQLIPGIGIVIGASVNRKLIMHLGEQAMWAYKLRHYQTHPEERYKPLID